MTRAIFRSGRDAVLQPADRTENAQLHPQLGIELVEAAGIEPSSESIFI